MKQGMTHERAVMIAGGMFVVSVIFSINHTFIDPSLIKAPVMISAAFMFYFMMKNPAVLMSRTLDEFGDRFDDSVDRKYFYGTTPLYPGILLTAILYIVVVKYDWLLL